MAALGTPVLVAVLKQIFDACYLFQDSTAHCTLWDAVTHTLVYGHRLFKFLFLDCEFLQRTATGTRRCSVRDFFTAFVAFD